MRLLECPRDGEILATNDLPLLQYDSCETCSGVWLPGQALRTVLTPAGMEDLSKAPCEDRSAPACPECRRPTDPVDLRGTAVDSCPDCGGVWLDGGEMVRIASLLRSSSGLAEAHHGISSAKHTGKAAIAGSFLDVLAILLGTTGC